MFLKKIVGIFLIPLVAAMMVGCTSSSEKTLEEQETAQQVQVTENVTNDEQVDLPNMIHAVVVAKGEGNVLFGSQGEEPLQMVIENIGHHPFEFVIQSIDGNMVIERESLSPNESYEYTFNESKIDLPKGEYAVYFQQNSGAEVKVSVKTEMIN